MLLHSEQVLVDADWSTAQLAIGLWIPHSSIAWPCCWQGVEYTPEEKGTGKGRAGSYSNFDACIGLKVAPTVFDRTSAIGSALLIAACGGLTLFLRYYGSIFLD